MGRYGTSSDIVGSTPDRYERIAKQLSFKYFNELPKLAFITRLDLSIEDVA